MKYPIMITEDDCQDYGIELQTGEGSEIKNRRFLNIVHQTLYGFVYLCEELAQGGHRKIQRRA